MGPGLRSEFFDPKTRVTPHPLKDDLERKVRTPQGRIPRERGGGALQGAPTDSVTENIPPGGQPPGKGEKVG